VATRTWPRSPNAPGSISTAGHNAIRRGEDSAKRSAPRRLGAVAQFGRRAGTRFAAATQPTSRPAQITRLRRLRHIAPPPPAPHCAGSVASEMNRIAATFARLREAGRTALVPYVTAGDPSPRITVPLLDALVGAGADVIELGVPFSDPMADGPVIQRASERAL